MTKEEFNRLLGFWKAKKAGPRSKVVSKYMAKGKYDGYIRGRFMSIRGTAKI